MIDIDLLMNKAYKIRDKSVLFLLARKQNEEALAKVFSYLPNQKKTVCSTKLDLLAHIKKISNGAELEYIYSGKGKFYSVDFTDGECSIEKEKTLGHYDTVVFSDNLKKSELFKYASCTPKVLIGNLKESNLDYYDIWLTYKQVCEYIYMSVKTRNGKREIFEWEKDIDNPIEISVILPIYNVEKYLEKCLNNLTKWDANYLEIIAVNDGSPDNSLGILEKISKNEDRLVIINKSNGGCSSARQEGMEAARGKYIGFVDPDDFTTPDMFYLLHRRAMLGYYDVCYCGYNRYFENSGKIVPEKEDAIYEPFSTGTQNINDINSLISDLRIAIWRGIYKKQFLTNNQIAFNTNLRRFDDLPFKIEVMAKAKSVVSVEDFMYNYRLERPGQDVAVDDDRLFVHFEIFEYLDREIVDKLDEERITDRIQIVKLDTHYWALKKIGKEFRKEYLIKAKKDIGRNMSYFRYLLCCWNYRGKKYIAKAMLLSMGIIIKRRD